MVWKNTTSILHGYFNDFLLVLGLLMNNWLGIVGIVGPSILTFLYRIHVEEKELKAHFGSTYDEYRRKCTG